jgi:hypothetical protein
MKNRTVVRPKHYDRPGHRSQTAATVDLKAPTITDFEDDADPYDIFNQLTAGEKASLDPTLSYSSGYRDGRDGRPIRGSSPEYEDGYLAGLKVRGETVQ